MNPGFVAREKSSSRDGEVEGGPQGKSIEAVECCGAHRAHKNGLSNIGQQAGKAGEIAGLGEGRCEGLGTGGLDEAALHQPSQLWGKKSKDCRL